MFSFNEKKTEFLCKLDFYFRVIPKCEGEAIAAKYSCAFCETTAADDYEYVQQLFHRTVREVRKERERVVLSNSIDEESSTIPINSNINLPSPSSSSSSSSSVHFTLANDTEKIPIIPFPPPIPPNLTQKPPKLVKPDSQSSINSLSSNLLVSSPIKSNSSGNNITETPTTPSIKRSTSKPISVFSKFFK